MWWKILFLRFASFSRHSTSTLQRCLLYRPILQMATIVLTYVITRMDCLCYHFVLKHAVFCAVQQLLHLPRFRTWLHYFGSYSCPWWHVFGSWYVDPCLHLVRYILTIIPKEFLDVFLAEALAKQINEDHLAKNQLYPSFDEIREISAHIGAAVAAKAYELGMLFLSLFLLVRSTIFTMVLLRTWDFDQIFGLMDVGLATRLPQPKDLFGYAKSCMYSPSYRKYR
jgi:hypothetical protein